MKIEEIQVQTIFGGPNVHNPNEINPYVGCMFHCVYCYVDGNEEPEGTLQVKLNAAEIVERDIETRSPGVAIFLSSQTDPYVFAEKKYGITRSCIETVLRHPRYRLSILTKSDLVVRDLDLLSRIPCEVQFSIAVLNPEAQEVVEPYAPPVERRLSAIKQLEEAGIPTSVRIKPILPFGLTPVRELVETVASVTKGPLVVQGVDLGVTYMNRVAQAAYKHFPEQLTEWLMQPEKVRAEREATIDYLRSHPRVKYEAVADVLQLIQARFHPREGEGAERAASEPSDNSPVVS